MSGVGNGINAQAGPSRSLEQAFTASQPAAVCFPLLSQTDISPQIDESGERLAKRARIKRSSKACRSCRSRKRKCGGAAPDPCPNCIAAEETCNWDVEDGRSSAVRRSRVKLVKEEGVASVGHAGSFQDQPWSVDNLDWLSHFGGTEYGLPPETSSSDAASMHNPFDFAAFPTPPPHFFSPANHVPEPTRSASGNYQQPSETKADAPMPISLPMGWPSDVDPFELIMAFSSRMPEVEQTSAQDGISPSSDDMTSTGRTSASAITSAARRDTGQGGKNYVKVTWWRPHGQTAIAPGLKRMTLKVRVNDETASERATARSPADAGTGIPPIELFSSGGRVPSVPIMKHLCTLFSEFFGSQYPFLDLERCIADLEAGNGSVFLLNCIAATAARFSTHPSIALPGLQPHEYGNVFFETAKEMLGSMLAVPLRETIVALLLLCHVGFANDSEAEEWMFAGMAVRLAIDLGIDREIEEEGISSEDRRLNRLVFWSVVLLDFALAFGTGRQPTFRVAEITQTLPTDEDLPVAPGTARHPFPFACQMMLSYGRLIELLNTRIADEDGSIEREAQKCKIKAIKAYAQLPPDMRWDVQNLQLHHQAGRAPIYMQLHLWMHTIIASGHLTGIDYVRRPPLRKKTVSDAKSGAITPNGVAWRSSARTIGDILLLSDIVCPRAYVGLPFCNQAFYVAGSCYVKELEQEREVRLNAMAEESGDSAPPSSRAGSAQGDHDDKEKMTDLFWSIQATVSTENIDKLRKGLAKQTTYWSGVAWVAEALEQRIQGIAVGEIDLATVTEKLSSIASIPDAGLLHRSGDGQQVVTETSQVFDLAHWLRE